LPAFSLIVPFYRNGRMLEEQVRVWEQYPSIPIILVDDGSPEDARSIVMAHASEQLRERLSLYRITVDIPWNRGGARNLGTAQATTDWVVHIDIDHVLPAECAARLLGFKANPTKWYRFERYRNGKADETRRKDKIPEGVEFGKIHPHIDSYLCTREMYCNAGGYNEDFSGCLGGGSPFLALLEAEAKPEMLPPDVSLQVYTRSTVKDASDWALSRDRGEFSRRKAKMKKPYRGKNPLRFPWEQQCIRG
jgi:glycosyltransferase involved in cell wall biosynthesis